MKFFRLYSLALAGALMLGACSSSDDLNDGGATANEGKSYIAVNIKSVGTAGAGTRADDRDYTQGGTYEDGAPNEGAISAVRFFFFNSDGSPYIMKGSKGNYRQLDASVNGGNENDKKDNHLQTIEGKTTAMLVIEGETKTAPAYMIAVVNPGTLKNLSEGVSYRESQLRDAFKDSRFVNITTDGKYSDFVMSNSVYSENDARVCASSVSGHVEDKPDEAAKNPVDIYVERVLAKATTNVNTTNGMWKQISDGVDAGKYKIKVGEIFIDAENKKDVYAVVQGWGLADENRQALLEKMIDVNQNNLTNTILGITPWTSPDYHRCFWEASVGITPASGTNPNLNHKFSEITTPFGATPLYTCPNTPTYAEAAGADGRFTNGVNTKPYENTLTKVLVAAKLVYYDDANNAHPADICKYRGIQILGAENVKKQVAKDHPEYWTVDPLDDSKHILLAPTDLEYTKTNLAGSDPLKSYEVRPVLKTGVTVYKKKSDGSFETTGSNDELNKKLAESPVQVRNEGMTYYYTPIRHLANSKTEWGYYGVVRNHSYRITINTISGFGTPVYDPKEIIVPVIPKDTETYLAARINVLSWRVVTSGVDLDGTK